MRGLTTRLATIDTQLLRYLARIGLRPWIRRPVLTLTKFGEHGRGWIVAAAVGAVLIPQRRPLFLLAARTTIKSFAVNQAIKFFVRRARPQVDGLPQAVATGSQRSFPSAHATTSFAAARILAPALRPTPIYVTATAVALTRLLLAVHYPSDSIAGAMLGNRIGRRALRRLERESA